MGDKDQNQNNKLFSFNIHHSFYPVNRVVKQTACLYMQLKSVYIVNKNIKHWFCAQRSRGGQIEFTSILQNLLVV